MRTAIHHRSEPPRPAVTAQAATAHQVAAQQAGRPAPAHDISGVAIAEVAQRKAMAGANGNAYRAPARTGLPERLKAGVEALSGLSMDTIRVHHNSPEPARLQAHAYTKGSDIHLAPGQERHLPHEAWHVVQQAQRRASPTRRTLGVDLNDDPGLEAEADTMGARAAALSPPIVAPSVSPAASGAATVQRAVVLGREKTSWYHVLSGDTMKRLLTMDDYPTVLKQVTDYLMTLPDKPDPDAGLTPKNVAAWKGLKEHTFKNYGRIKDTLKRWIEASGTAVASTTGHDERAEWREFESIEELALALAHETHPEYMVNMAQEGLLADQVNNDEWVQAQLASVVRRTTEYTSTAVSSFRYYAETIEKPLFGSYNWAGKVSSIFSLFKSVDKREPSEAISATKQAITADITFLHDLMERWSSSGAGSIAAQIHEYVGVEKVLPDAPDKAFEATALDRDRSDFRAESGPAIGTYRTTKTVSPEEHEEVLFEIAIKSAIRAAEKSKEEIDEIARLRQLLKTAEGEPEKLELNSEIARLGQRIEKRKARLAAEGLGQFSFNDNWTPETTVGGREQQGRNLPDYGLIAGMLKQKQRERTRDKLKRVTVDAIDKSSKAKGRRNVGTRLENNSDTLLARIMSAPVTAGRSMTTARMMQLVEKVGGTDEEKTAVAYALFAYWARTYNQGLTPVHTFHETMDVAYNFGVPYKPFHYPTRSEGRLDLMNPGAYLPMSKLAFGAVPGQQHGNQDVAREHRLRWDEFRRLLEQVPRTDHDEVADDQAADDLGMMYAESEPSAKSSGGSAPKRPGFPASEFVRRRNAGGGDCLFYALEGHNLTPREVLDLRQEVAHERTQMPERGNVNAWNIMTALHQTPATHGSANRMMTGRHDVSNAVYAAMQAVPGVYAGDDELVQYCRLRRISAAVVSWNGELQIADGTGIRTVAYPQGGQAEALRQALAETDMALYKSPDHWERIDSVRELELDRALALVPNAPSPSILHMSQDVRQAFGLLGLPLGDFDHLDQAFRRMARPVHPDKGRAPDAEAFKRLGQARDLLKKIAEDSEAKDQVKLLALTDKSGAQ